MSKIISVSYIKGKIEIDYTKEVVIRKNFNLYVYHYMSCSNYYLLKEVNSIFNSKVKRKIKNKEVLVI